MRFWTLLQTPLNQAVLIEDGKTIAQVPSKPPNTPVRRVGVIGSYGNYLACPMHSSFQLWEGDGLTCVTEFYHPLIYAPHACVEFDGHILICSSGLDLFLLMDASGEVLWRWFGGKNGLGEFPEHILRDDWPVLHNSGKNYQLEGGAHFNSIWVEPDRKGFLTSCLKNGQIVRIKPYEDGFEEVAHTKCYGVHSPMMSAEHGLIYGKEKGIVVDGTEVLTGYDWVKYVRETAEGYVFTHEVGVTFVDRKWNVLREVPLPRPFQLAHLEL